MGLAPTPSFSSSVHTNRWSRFALHIRATIVMAGVLSASHALAAPADWAINEDYKQLDSRGASDFSILLQGNVGGRITGGGMSSVTNPFSSPALATSMDAFGNTIVRFSGSNSIPQDANANRHFGIFGSGPKPRALVKAWSFATAPAMVPVPKSNFAFLYNGVNNALQITIENTSPDTVTFQDVGYILSSTEVPIDDLNRNVLPPSSFLPLDSLDHQYLPGVSDSISLFGVSPTEFALAYGTVFFSGASAGNAYNSTGGEWSEVLVGTQIPEPGTLALILLAAVLLTFHRRNWRSVRFTRNRATCNLLILLAAGSVSTAPLLRADAFVLPLLPPAQDDYPTVQIGAVVGGMQVNIGNVIIDTGASSSLRLTPAAAASLGMDPNGGTPGTTQGIGGASAVRNGVATPAGLGFTGANGVVAPPDQAAQSPGLPGAARVGNISPGVNGLIGSTYLQDFNYGRIGNYFFLARKNEGAAGIATATAIASFLSLGAPFRPGQDGRPTGTQSGMLVPTPNQIVPPGVQQDSLGFDIGVAVTNPSGATLAGTQFVISSGLPISLISEQVASALGLSLSGLPSITTFGNYGAIQVLQANLQLAPFTASDSPTFLLPVGILSASDNPFGFNYLGEDVLSQFAYWEVSQDSSGLARFFGATSLQAVPEPATILLVSLAIVSLILNRRRAGTK
jgi:hypothetical protein